MKGKITKFCLVAVATAGIAGQVFAGGNVGINWSNDGLTTGTGAPFYTDVTGQTALSAGTAANGDGFLIQLVALGVDNSNPIVLASGTIGDVDLGLVNGQFDIAPSAVSSNVIHNAIAAGNTVLGVKFYDVTAQQLAVASSYRFGIVRNNADLVPSSDFPATPPPPFDFAIDITDSNFQGPRTVGTAELLGHGFF